MVAKELTLLIANFRTLVNIQVVMSFPFPKKTGSQWGGCCTTQSSGCAYRVSRPVMEVSVYPDHTVNHQFIAHKYCFFHIIYRIKFLSKWSMISCGRRQIFHFLFSALVEMRTSQLQPLYQVCASCHVTVMLLLSCTVDLWLIINKNIINSEIIVVIKCFKPYNS